jgi:hypothetical protein
MTGLCTEGKLASTLWPFPDILSMRKYKNNPYQLDKKSKKLYIYYLTS